MARDLAGTVVLTTPRHFLVKAARTNVSMGARIVDVRDRPVGQVADIIGPVASPYLVVRPGKKAKIRKLTSPEVFTP